MLSPKRQLSAMFGDGPTSCVSPTLRGSRPRIESWGKDELQISPAGVPVVTPKIPGQHGNQRTGTPRPPPLDLDGDGDVIRKARFFAPPPPPPPVCGECGDDVALEDAVTCRGGWGCAALVCGACHSQSQSTIGKLAPALRDATACYRNKAELRHLFKDGWSHGRMCERCLDVLEARVNEAGEKHVDE